MMKNCSECESPLKENTAFCESCGAPAEPEKTQPVQETPEQEVKTAYCIHCGAKIPEALKICPKCGKSADGSETEKSGFELRVIFSSFRDVTDETAAMSAEDITKNKVMAVLAYFNILVLIPVFAAKSSPYACFHANQGLILWITNIVWWILDRALMSTLGNFWIAGKILSAFFAAGYLVIFALAVLGIVHAVKGRAKELPLIGKQRLLK